MRCGTLTYPHAGDAYLRIGPNVNALSAYSVRPHGETRAADRLVTWPGKCVALSRRAHATARGPDHS
jgi:hypothetical protein